MYRSTPVASVPASPGQPCVRRSTLDMLWRNAQCAYHVFRTTDQRTGLAAPRTRHDQCRGSSLNSCLLKLVVRGFLVPLASTKGVGTFPRRYLYRFIE